DGPCVDRVKVVGETLQCLVDVAFGVPEPVDLRERPCPEPLASVRIQTQKRRCDSCCLLICGVSLFPLRTTPVRIAERIARPDCSLQEFLLAKYLNRLIETA